MNTSSFERLLKGFCNRQPFQSFLIELLSGGRVVVSHPETIGVDGDMVHHQDPTGRHRFFETEAVSDLRDIPPKG